MAELVFQSLQDVGRNEPLNAGAVHHGALDDGGTDIEPFVVRHEEYGFYAAVEPAVHERQLEFELEIRDGAQTAEYGAAAPLGGVVHGQSGERRDFYAVAFGEGFISVTSSQPMMRSKRCMPRRMRLMWPLVMGSNDPA